MQPNRVLIVEDSVSLAETYRAFLGAIGCDVSLAGSGKEALALTAATQFACVVLDIKLPDMTGFDLMRRIRADHIGKPVVLSANGSVSLAVDVIRAGASDFLVKPFSADRLRNAVQHAIRCNEASEAGAQPPEVQATDSFGNFVGESQPMQAVYRVIKSAAPTNATVFVTGESGTGKEVCAETLHLLSRRAKGPFIALNCAAIPKDLLESEIFGHVKGAFTGATSERNGAALQADGGTLFLDEICDMDLALQAKLLRFLQTRQVQRLGEDRLRASDVRIVCATNRNPQTEVAEGRFREDLFYRLHVIPLEMPPLKVRGGDILAIARHYLAAFAKEDGKQFKRFHPDAESALESYGWPGNIRQLQNVIRNIVVLNDGETVTEDMLPYDLLGQRTRESEGNQTGIDALRFVLAQSRKADNAEAIRPLEDVIRATIEAAIATFDGSVPRAAAALDVSPSTLYRRLEGWKGIVALAAS